MKAITAVLVGLFVSGPAWANSVSVSYLSRYIGSIVTKPIHSEPVLWTDMYLDLPHDFFFYGWKSMDLQDNDMSSSWGDEFDLTVGRNFDIRDLNWSAAISYYNVLPLSEWYDQDVWTTEIRASRSFEVRSHTLRPEMRMGYIWVSKGFSDGAVYIQPNLNHKFNLTGRLSFSQMLMLSWEDGFDFDGNSSDGLFIRWDPNLSFNLTNKLTLSVGGVMIEPLHGPKDGRGDETAFLISLALSF